VQETPFTVGMRLGVQVASASVELQAEGGGMLLQGALSGVGARMVAYPSTTDLQLDITMVGGGAGRWQPPCARFNGCIP
jgi:hypothetical protein